ncbi:MBL fold metallo-hydrolase [candidate division KSB1 bacterium]|nr:MBL fold metallo-hydrolase [candidate division KSB1 bacterium]
MIVETVEVSPLAVNCTILGCDSTRQAVVIDPGDDLELMLKVLKQHHLSATKILITHGHIDHIGAVGHLQRALKVETYMHRDDSAWLTNAKMHAAMFGIPDPGAIVIDQYINEGDSITVGDLSIDVLHTPGHSAGSVTYCVGEHLIVGDVLFHRSIGRTDLPGGDYDTLIETINNKIFTRDDDMIVHPGHGQFTTVGDEKMHNPFFDHKI